MAAAAVASVTGAGETTAAAMSGLPAAPAELIDLAAIGWDEQSMNELVEDKDEEEPAAAAAGSAQQQPRASKAVGAPKKRRREPAPERLPPPWVARRGVCWHVSVPVVRALLGKYEDGRWQPPRQSLAASPLSPPRAKKAKAAAVPAAASAAATANSPMYSCTDPYSCTRIAHYRYYM
eukprot:COSAG01_NODE_15356_length_1346_cov_16.060946_1_plen_178_part_00